MVRVFSSFILWLSLLLAPIFAVWAADPTPAAEPYRDCGQECAYRRAQELNSLHTLYLIEKIDLMQAAMDRAGGDADAKTKLIHASIPGFCYIAETGDDCFRRFKRVEKEELYSLRKQYVTLGDQIKSLDSSMTVVDASGQKMEVGFAGPSVVDNPDLYRGEPSVLTPTAADLARQYDANRSLHQIDMNDSVAYDRFKAWVENNTRPVPNEDDFVDYELVLIDRDNPSAGTVSKIKRDNCPHKTKAGVCLRYDAYLKAKADYETFQAKMADYRKDMLEKKNYDFKPGTQRLERKNLEDASGQVGIIAFMRARNMVVDAVNKSGLGGAKAEVKANGDRKVAAKAAAEQAQYNKMVQTFVDDAKGASANPTVRDPAAERVVSDNSLSRVQQIYKRYFPDADVKNPAERQIKAGAGPVTQRLQFGQETFDALVDGVEPKPGQSGTPGIQTDPGQ